MNQFITRASHVLVIISFASVVHAQQPSSTPSEPVVVVSGEGLVNAAPDQAWVTLAPRAATGIRKKRRRRMPRR